jgi:hypothetical protein
MVTESAISAGRQMIFEGISQTVEPMYYLLGFVCVLTIVVIGSMEYEKMNRPKTGENNE